MYRYSTVYVTFYSHEYRIPVVPDGGTVAARVGKILFLKIQLTVYCVQVDSRAYGRGAARCYYNDMIR